MNRCLSRVVPAVLLAAAAAFPAHAADWGQLATISSTLGVNANRLCVGEGLRSDIGCPTYAPYVDPTNGFLGVGTTTPAAPFEVSGSILLRGINSGIAPSPVAAVEFFTGRTSTGGLNAGQTRGDLAFNFGASYGGYRHFIATKHNSVVGNGNAIEFYLNSGASAATSSAPGTGNVRVMGIYGSGNVGISTTNPNAKLEVNGDISATNLRLSGNLYVSGSQTIDGVTFANGGVSATGIITATSFSGDGSRLTGLASGDRITSGTSSVIVSQSGHISFTTAGTERMVINSSGNVGIGTTAPQAKLSLGSGATAQKLLLYDNANTRYGLGIQGGELRLFTPASGAFMSFGGITTADGSTFTEKMRFDTQNGYLGIGTSTPNVPMTVEASTNQLNLRQAGNTWGLLVGAGTNYTGGAVNSAFVINVNSGPLALGAGNAERMRITSAGNVGIGTTIPAKTLDVSGTAQIVSRTLVGGSGTPSATLQVSGSLLLAGNDNIPCTASVLGLVRRNPTTGRLQACR